MGDEAAVGLHVVGQGAADLAGRQDRRPLGRHEVEHVGELTVRRDVTGAQGEPSGRVTTRKASGSPPNSDSAVKPR